MGFSGLDTAVGAHSRRPLRIELIGGHVVEGDNRLRVRAGKEGVSVGCTFVTWEAWHVIKKIVEKAESDL